MPLVDIDRASTLDKIHTKRILHAFAQVVLRLMWLEDRRVDGILNEYSIALMPGPRAGIDYSPLAKQILEAELKAEKARLAKEAKPKGKKKK